MAYPPPLNLTRPAGFPGDMPSEPWPLGPYCSRYSGTPQIFNPAFIDPNSQHMLQYKEDKIQWAKTCSEYMIKLKTWIQENMDNEDPRVQLLVANYSRNIDAYTCRFREFLP